MKNILFQYILTEEDDTLIQTPSGDKPGNAKIVRKFTEDGMEMVRVNCHVR